MKIKEKLAKLTKPSKCKNCGLERNWTDYIYCSDCYVKLTNEKNEQITKFLNRRIK